MSWNLILKKNLLKFVLTGPINSVWGSQIKHKRAFSVEFEPSLTLILETDGTVQFTPIISLPHTSNVIIRIFFFFS